MHTSQKGSTSFSVAQGIGLVYPLLIVLVVLALLLNPQVEVWILLGVLLAVGAANIALAYKTACFLNEKGGNPQLLQGLGVYWRRLSGVVLLLLAGAGWGLWAVGYTLAEVFFYVALLGAFLVPEGAMQAIFWLYSRTASRLEALRVHVHNFSAFERFGACSALFTEKTGTLTLGNLTVQVVLLPNGQHVLLKGVDFDASKRKEMWRLAATSLLANAKGSLEGVDLAFQRFGTRMHLRQEDLLRHLPQCGALPFTQEQRFGASFHKLRGQVYAAVKGAPEVVAAMCGTPEASWLKEVESLAEGGYRMVAVAGGVVDGADENALKAGKLGFLGLVALVDPLQEGAMDALAACRIAGAQTQLLTGDHPATALITAKALSLAGRRNEILTPEDFKALPPQGQDFANLATNTPVFAALRPQDKANIVLSSAAKGACVATVSKASVPLATAQAVKVSVDPKNKEADICLLQGKITPLPAVVRLSRQLFSTLTRLSAFWLSVGAAVVGVFALGLGVNGCIPVPLLFWADSLGLAFCFAASFVFSKPVGLMRRHPRAAAKGVMNLWLIVYAVLAGFIAAGAVWWAFNYSLEALGALRHEAQLIAGLTFGVVVAVLAGATRPQGQPLLAKGQGVFVGLFLLTVVSYGAVFFLPPESQAFLGGPAPKEAFLIVFGAVVGVFLALELLRKCIKNFY